MLDSLPAIPLWVVADKGYASNAMRERIWDMGARSAIPAKRRDGLLNIYIYHLINFLCRIS